MTLSEKLKESLYYAFATSSAYNLYVNPPMMVVETACGMTPEQSSEVRAGVSLGRPLVIPLISLVRDFSEKKLGIKKENGKAGTFDSIFWLSIAGMDIGASYLIYNKFAGAKEGLQSLIPAIVGYGLVAWRQSGKVIDTFKDAFEFSPHLRSAFPESMPQEDKRKQANAGYLAAYGTLAAYYLYAHSSTIAESIKQLVN